MTEQVDRWRRDAPANAPSIDPATLAAFVDRRLPESSRAAVLHVLAHSASDREVLADLAWLLRSEASEEDVAGPARHP